MLPLLSIVTILASLFSLKFIRSTPLPSPIPKPLAYIICIDPGHGNDDSGAQYNDLDEKKETLDIAYRLKDLLQKNKYGVVMTRIDDSIDPSNSDRAQICNGAHANALVSIHLNFNYDPTLDYTQGLYGDDGNKDINFTETVHQSLVKELGVPDGDITDFNDNILNKAKMPATLQETVFLTSDDEYAKLNNGSGSRQQQIAQALFDGIKNWFAKRPAKWQT